MRAVITGASSGLGRAIAIELSLSKGPFGKKTFEHLILSGMNYDRLKAVPVATDERNLKLVVGDMLLRGTHDTIAKACDDPVDVLILAAAIYEKQPIEQARYHSVVETNLIAPMRLTERLWPLLVEAKGTVVIINSVAGIGGAGIGETAYAATKAGLTGFATALRQEAAPVGVKIIEVFPGAMNTPMLADVRADLADCINPAEAARIIVSTVLTAKECRSASVNQIHIGRAK